MREARHVIVRPVITEKTSKMGEAQNAYVFVVSRAANKIEIRRAVEDMFDVKVNDVRTMVYRGKNRRLGRHVGRKPSYKKAVVKLAEGEYIDLHEGV